MLQSTVMSAVVSTVLISFCLLTGCGRRGEPPYGRTSNAQRRTLGVPTIPDDAVLYADLGTQMDWAHPAFHAHGLQGKPIHARKQVALISATEPDYELDIYYSGRRYPDPSDPGGMIDEDMQVKFDYRLHAAGKEPWSCTVTPGGPDAGDHSLPEAEAILRRWGLERLAW